DPVTDPIAPPVEPAPIVASGRATPAALTATASAASLASTSWARAAVAFVRSLRPHQWIKNVFVAAPLVFAQKLGEPSYVLRSALAVLAFCVVSGAVYAFNDVRDIEADRCHPTKRHRPIASGQLSQRAALVGSALLAAAALAGCLALSPTLALVAALYLAQNVAHTLH